MNHHELKIPKDIYKNIVRGKQTIIPTEYSDKYKVGDVLILQEHNKQPSQAADYIGYTGEAVKAEIEQTMRGNKNMGLKRNVIVIAFKVLTEQ